MSMWEPFSAEARRAMVESQLAAQRFEQNYIGTEHLLLGIAGTPESAGARLLSSCGIERTAIEDKLEAMFKRGKGVAVQEMVFTPRAKRVIELAFEEARDANDRYIGTEHLLLGIMREGEGVGAQILLELRASLGELRRHLTNELRERPPQKNISDRPAFSAFDHVQLAMPAGKENEARAFYVEALGMTEMPKPQELQARGGVWFVSGNVQLHLGIDPDFHSAKKAHPALRCSNFFATVKRLRKHRVDVQIDAERPRNRAYIHDPFGNRIELIG